MTISVCEPAPSLGSPVQVILRMGRIPVRCNTHCRRNKPFSSNSIFWPRRNLMPFFTERHAYRQLAVTRNRTARYRCFQPFCARPEAFAFSLLLSPPVCMFVISLNFRFAPFVCASYASHVLYTTNRPPKQVPPGDWILRRLGTLRRAWEWHKEAALPK